MEIRAASWKWTACRRILFRFLNGIVPATTSSSSFSRVFLLHVQMEKRWASCGLFEAVKMFINSEEQAPPSMKLYFIFVSWNRLVDLMNIDEVLSPFFSLSHFHPIINYIDLYHSLCYSMYYLMYIIQRLFVNDHFKFFLSVWNEVKRWRLLLLEIILLFIFISWNRLLDLTNIDEVLSPFFSLFIVIINLYHSL